MVPGSVTDTVVAPGTARRSKPLIRSRVLLVPTAPHTRAAVRPRTATMAATQYRLVDGRFLAWSGGMGGRVGGGGRSSVSEEVMSFVSFSSPFTLLQTWPTVRSHKALIRRPTGHRFTRLALPGGRHGARRMAMVRAATGWPAGRRSRWRLG